MCTNTETTKNAVINKPTSAKLRPNSCMNTGNINGSNRCPKCELACAKPTRPMMVASCFRGTRGVEARRVVLDIGSW